MIDFGEHVPEKKSLDLTPMIDVVFLLLIFFMLTSIFAKPMLPLNLPKAETGQVAEEPKVTISLLQDGTMRLDDQPVELAGLTAALAVRFGQSASRELSLRADQGVPFGQVVKVMDLAKQAGAEEIAVVTERLK
jgi:biopolymer transport protein ExbD